MDHMVYQDKNRLKSIFEGLDNIRAIVFGFYREKGSPSTLFESYKFTIKEKCHSNTDIGDNRISILVTSFVYDIELSIVSFRLSKGM